MPRKKLWLFLAIAHSILILILSFINVDSFPEIGSEQDDKIFHVLAYGLLALLWFKTFEGFNINGLSKIALLIFAYGMIIEVCQGVFAAHRQFDVGDLLANSIGITVALLVVLIWKRVTVKKI